MEHAYEEIKVIILQCSSSNRVVWDKIIWRDAKAKFGSILS